MKSLTDWDDDILVVLNGRVGYMITYDANGMFVDAIVNLEEARRFYKLLIFKENFIKNEWKDIVNKEKEIISFDWLDDATYDEWVEKFAPIVEPSIIEIESIL